MIILFELALTFYMISMILGFVEVTKSSRYTSVGMTGAAIIGFFLHSLNLIDRFILSGHMPAISVHEAISLFTWSIVLIFLLIKYRYKIGLLGSFIMPWVFGFMLISSAFPREIQPLAPVLNSFWLIIHTMLAFLSYASFGLSCGLGIMFLIQYHFVKSKKLSGLFKRLPSLNILDDVNYRLIKTGFFLLTLAIISGSLWSETAWGSYWLWQPKQVWSLITWLIYAMIIHLRRKVGLRGRRGSILAILGYIVTLFTFFGVDLLLKGQHAFL
ncbi:MAG: c-type cytochrome biogenesis protein CcsB [Nitrospirae bacterium]|nr:c-type cytochrome biogenesis protein CcsB [Nitrospirota bacterium]MBF0541474.1 c-type cytochrome biogenesis protein CcsB [Nitrospirota bacterium]